MENLARILIYIACVTAVISTLLFAFSYLDFSDGLNVNSDLFDHFGSFFGGVVGALLTFSSVLYLIETFKEQRKEGVERRFFELLRYNRELLSSVDDEVVKLTSRKLIDHYKSTEKLLDEHWKTVWPDFELEPKGIKKQVNFHIIMAGLPRFIHAKTANEGVLFEILSNLIGPDKAKLLLFGIDEKDGLHIGKKPDVLPLENILQKSSLTIISAHYFRNLIHLVRFINNDRLLSFDEKYEHIRTLRSLMSAEEQGLLFLNALTDDGKGWGKGNRNRNLDLITKYNLVKNATSFIPQEIIRAHFPDIELQGDKDITEGRRKLIIEYRKWKHSKTRYDVDFVQSNN